MQRFMDSRSSIRQVSALVLGDILIFQALLLSVRITMDVLFLSAEEQQIVFLFLVKVVESTVCRVCLPKEGQIFEELSLH